MLASIKAVAESERLKLVYSAMPIAFEKIVKAAMNELFVDSNQAFLEFE
jgi:hypothetical protein